MSRDREKARELALKFKLSHFVQGDDGFGGEDEADGRAVDAILAAMQHAYEEAYKVVQSAPIGHVTVEGHAAVGQFADRVVHKLASRARDLGAE